ncbi:DUF5348 domain-containing protein [Nostoc sp. UHCC 0702]|nr:DUF5348 domain-containing protein [Nostoc sp. UHCC 0702]
MQELTLQTEIGGERPYLMNKPIHAGDCLQVFISGEWCPASCECYREKGSLHWYLIVYQPGNEHVIEDFCNTLCRF